MKAKFLRFLGITLLFVAIAIFLYVTIYSCIVKSCMDLYLGLIAKTINISIPITLARLFLGTILSGSFAFLIWLTGLYLYDNN